MSRPKPTFREALRFWGKLGLISFGGPAGQIAIMHTELVRRKGWIAEDRFLHALNFCMLLPGPEATQLATYCGWLLHGPRGGGAAGLLFFLPSAVLLWGLSWLYVAHGSLPAVEAVFHGLKPAVTAIVAVAVWRIGRRALRGPASWLLAAGAFGALYFAGIPFPWIILGAAILGLAGSRLGWEWMPGGGRGANPVASENLHESPGGWRRGAVVLLVIGSIWWLPILGAGLIHGRDGFLLQEGLFFSKAAMVTFGGAYAVLPYVGQQAVDHFGWLSGSQMLDGLGLAETTPGPLIIVVQFVGFLGGWNHPGSLPPLLAATLGAGITTWATFAPCFLWILLGAPYVERLRGNAGLTSALAAVTAAVVGVVLNLAVWFGQQVFLPADGGIDGFALAIAGAAFVALIRFENAIVPVVLGSAALGWVWSLF